MFLAGCNTSQNNKALFWDDADSLVAQIQGNNIREHMIILADDDMPVSYTHLTLPTKA